jgi:hypothetical protein
MWDSRVDDELGAAIQLKSLFVDALQFVMLHKENCCNMKKEAKMVFDIEKIKRFNSEAKRLFIVNSLRQGFEMVGNGGSFKSSGLFSS